MVVPASCQAGVVVLTILHVSYHYPYGGEYQYHGVRRHRLMAAYDYCCGNLIHVDLISKTYGGHHALIDLKRNVCPVCCQILVDEILNVIFFYLELHYIWLNLLQYQNYQNSFRRDTILK